MLLSPGDGPADAGRPGLRAKLAAWRRAFRPWRRQRPFVGGVLVVLAGLEMLLSGPIKLDQFGVNVVLQFGVEGAQATILPLALVLLGILVIAQPVHRIFYGVIALAISVYSIAGVNLGGWVIGFLLGVIGGVIAVSWRPQAVDAADDAEDGATRDEVEAERASQDQGAGQADEAQADEAQLAEDASQDQAAAPAADTEEPGAAPSGEKPANASDPTTEAIPKVESLSDALRAVSQKSAAAVVAGAMVLAGMGLPASASDTTAQEDTSFACVVFRICDDEPDPDPSPSPDESASDPAPDDGDGSADDGGAGSDDGATDPATGGDTEPGAGTGAGDGSQATPGGKGGDGGAKAGKDGTGDDAECAEPTQDGVVPPGEADAAPSDPCGEIDPQETIEKALQTELGTCIKVSFGGKYDLNVDLPGQCGAKEDGSVFSLPADLESRDLTIPLTGINGLGLANVPVKGNGERRDAIKISADKVKVDGFWLKSYAYDEGTVAGTDTRANFVSLEGNVHMYVSSIHANLPDGQDLLEVATKLLEGASLIEIVLAATDARMGFMGATSDTQVWDTFREQVWGDPHHPIGKGPEAGDP